MPVTSGISAALAAPLLEAVGFLEWDIHWSKAGGSAFALNMYKCNLAAFLFLCMAVYVNNAPWLGYAIDVNVAQNNPYGSTVAFQRYYEHQMNPVNHIKDVQQGPLEDYFAKKEEQERFEIMERQRLQREYEQQREFQRQQEQQMQEMQTLQMQMQERLEQPLQFLQTSQQGQLIEEIPHENQLLNREQGIQDYENRRYLADFGDGRRPVDSNEYVILDRRKKTPYDEVDNAMNQNMMGDMNNLNYFNNYNNAYDQQQQQEQPQQQQQQQQQFEAPMSYPERPDTYHSIFQGYRYQIPYIILSSFLGIVIGDCAELEALRLIGARRVLVVDTIKPFAAAILGSILLDENLYPAAFVGIVLAAVGVYIVLIASMEQVEEVKLKKRMGNMKRMEDACDYSNHSGGTGLNISSHGSVGSFGYIDDSDGNDAEIVSILNEEEMKIEIVGMHRRPLSRHDLGADMEEMFGSMEEDDLMMLLEDGRGIIDTTICCAGTIDNMSDQGRARTSSGGLRSFLAPNWGGSRVSLDNRSFSSMGSLEDLHIDVKAAMENFDRSDSDEFFIGEEIVSGIPGVADDKSTSNGTLLHQRRQNSPAPNSAQQTDKPLKSALKRSRYTSKNNFELGQSSDEGEMSPPTSCSPANSPKSEETALIPFPPNDSYHNDKEKKTSNRVSSKSKQRKTPLRARTSSSTSLASNSSYISFESECGPPPGLYGGVKRETKYQRSNRLRTGYFLALTNVLLDAYGSYLTKRHGAGMSTWEINLCRLGFAGCATTSVSLLMTTIASKRKRLSSSPRGGQQNYDSNENAHSQRMVTIRPWYKLPLMSIVSWITVSFGVCFVTFLAPALAQYSLFQIPLALSVSLCSITPLYTIPLGIVMKGERPSRRGYIGALLSVLGVIILCCFGVDVDSLD